jgi:hypothetical protein
MKITQMTTPKQWEGKFGTMYETEATLDDGRIGQVNMKRPDTWKIGDEVNVEATEGTYGLKFKFSKPDTFGGAQRSPAEKDAVQRRIDASWAVGQAINMLPPSATFDTIKRNARLLLELRDEIAETLERKS